MRKDISVIGALICPGLDHPKGRSYDQPDPGEHLYSQVCVHSIYIYPALIERPCHIVCFTYGALSKSFSMKVPLWASWSYGFLQRIYNDHRLHQNSMLRLKLQLILYEPVYNSVRDECNVSMWVYFFSNSAPTDTRWQGLASICLFPGHFIRASEKIDAASSNLHSPFIL